MTDPSAVMVRATRDQIKEFKSSLLWKDIKRELGMWKTEFQHEYNGLVNNAIDGAENSASVLTHMGSIFGRAAAVDYMLQLPDMFLQLLEDRKNESRHDETSGQ